MSGTGHSFAARHAPQVDELIGAEGDLQHFGFGQTEAIVAEGADDPTNVALVAGEVGGVAGESPQHLTQDVVEHLVQFEGTIDRQRSFLERFRQLALVPLRFDQLARPERDRHPAAHVAPRLAG